MSVAMGYTVTANIDATQNLPPVMDAPYLTQLRVDPAARSFEISPNEPLSYLGHASATNKDCSEAQYFVSHYKNFLAKQLERQQGSGPGKYRIPRIIHQFSPTKCFPSGLQEEITHKWWSHLSVGEEQHGWEYYLHDSSSSTGSVLVDQLFQLDIPEFPHLKLIANHCLASATSLSPMEDTRMNLFRYLILYLVGGVYMDLDLLRTLLKSPHTSPNQHQNSNDWIWKMDEQIVFRRENERGRKQKEHNDAFLWVVVDDQNKHFLSPAFLAVSPRHPLLYFAIQKSLLAVLKQDISGSSSFDTGPSIFAYAMDAFRKDAELQSDPAQIGRNVWNGTVLGTNNRSVTMFQLPYPSSDDTDDWVWRALQQDSLNGGGNSIIVDRGAVNSPLPCLSILHQAFT